MHAVGIKRLLLFGLVAVGAVYMRKEPKSEFQNDAVQLSPARFCASCNAGFATYSQPRRQATYWTKASPRAYSGSSGSYSSGSAGSRSGGSAGSYSNVQHVTVTGSAGSYSTGSAGSRSGGSAGSYGAGPRSAGSAGSTAYNQATPLQTQPVSQSVDQPAESNAPIPTGVGAPTTPPAPPDATTAAAPTTPPATAQSTDGDDCGCGDPNCHGSADCQCACCVNSRNAGQSAMNMPATGQQAADAPPDLSPGTYDYYPATGEYVQTSGDSELLVREGRRHLFGHGHARRVARRADRAAARADRRAGRAEAAYASAYGC